MPAEEGGALKMLADPQMHTATAEIVAGQRARYEIQRDIKAKVCTARAFEVALSAWLRRCG